MTHQVSVKTPLRPSLFLLLLGGTLNLFCSGELGLYALPTSPTAELGPASLGFAGASTAIIADAEAIVTNPANLVYLEGKRALGGTYQILPRDEQKWSASIVDGEMPVISAFQFSSVSYGDENAQSYYLTASYKTSYGAFGASAKAVRASHASTGNGWHFTGTTGILVPIAYGLTLGGHLKNFPDTERDALFPPELHLGILYTHPQTVRLTFEADRRYKVPRQDWSYSTAADILLGEYFAVRGGYRWDHSGHYDFWSLGGAILGPKGDLTAAMIRPTEGKAKWGMSFGLLMKI